MAEARAIPRDQGISDILESEDMYSRSSNKHGEGEHNSDVDISHSGEESSDRMYVPKPTTINKKDEEKHEAIVEPSETGQNRVNGNHESCEETELDLANPESVIHMLETVDLNEEDTENLLQEAYNMNRKLKEMLRRQEKGSSDSSGSGSTKSEKGQKKSKSKTGTNKRENGNASGSVQSSEASSRVGSSFGSRKILPPITNEKERSVYTIKLQRSRTNIPDTGPTVVEHKLSRSKSSKDALRTDTTSPTRRRKTKPEPKPEWNDRFNFT